MGAIESVVVPAGPHFTVDVLRPADFRAGLVYMLYYVKGLSLEDLPAQPREVRVDTLRAHLVQYALGERRWDPPDLAWYARHARLDDADLEAARAAAKDEYERRRRQRSFLRRLFRR